MCTGCTQMYTRGGRVIPGPPAPGIGEEWPLCTDGARGHSVGVHRADNGGGPSVRGPRGSLTPDASRCTRTRRACSVGAVHVNQQTKRRASAMAAGFGVRCLTPSQKLARPSPLSGAPTFADQKVSSPRAALNPQGSWRSSITHDTGRAVHLLCTESVAMCQVP